MAFILIAEIQCWLAVWMVSPPVHRSATLDSRNCKFIALGLMGTPVSSQVGNERADRTC